MSILEEVGLANGLHRYIWYKETKEDKNLKGYIIKQKLIKYGTP